jgi:polar amino acid transport system permease protein
MKPGVCALNNLAGCDEGIFLTLKVTFYAYGMALLIGLVVGIMRVPSTPTTLLAKLIQTFLTLFSTLYVEVVRGIPLLVILIYAGFVVAPNLRDNPINIPNWSDSILDAVLVVVNLPFQAWNALGIRNIGDLGSFPDPIVIDMPPVTQAVVGLAFGYGAFVAEIFRAGIQSISRGQMEAARSLGMSYPQAMRFVILPQAVRVVLPPLGNDFISMLKDSALISVLALPDLLQLGRLYVSRTFRAFEGYNTVAILYLMMTLFLSMMVRIIERRTRLPR